MLTWLPVSKERKRGMEAFFRLWQGTPYRKDTREIGYGVDCKNLVIAFLFASKCDRPEVDFPRTNPTISQIRKKFLFFPVFDETKVTAGDIVITQHPNWPDKHAMIVSPAKDTYYHAIEPYGAVREKITEELSIISVHRPIIKNYSMFA